MENDRWKMSIVTTLKNQKSGSFKRDTLADMGSKKLWNLLTTEPYITLGTYTGNMAVQQAKAGLKAIYVSGWLSSC